MPCFHPLHGFRAGSGGITFRKAGSTGLPMSVPCGQCIGCRLERSRQMAVRCMHEASLHDENSFVTLTYDDEHLPLDGSLDREAMPKFFKRMRKRFKVRYLYCGEYGDENLRPHYHAIIFGCGFADRYHWAVRNGLPVWRSPILERLWPFGQSEIGTVTFESAAYVARYCCKKVTLSKASSRAAYERWKARYERVDPYTGEVIEVEPEFSQASRRPGLGRGWLEKYADEVYPSDEVIVRGVRCKPPRYYDLQMEAETPEDFAAVKGSRRRGRNRAEETAARLQVREVCQQARMNLLPRRLEE